MAADGPPHPPGAEQIVPVRVFGYGWVGVVRRCRKIGSDDRRSLITGTRRGHWLAGRFIGFGAHSPPRNLEPVPASIKILPTPRGQRRVQLEEKPIHRFRVFQHVVDIAMAELNGDLVVSCIQF